MLEFILFILLGIILGLITGLLPGIHPNTIVALVPVLVMAMPVNIYYLIAMIVSMSIVNVMADFVPSILLGAPDPDVALSVMPGHRLLMEGRGYKAIKLSVIGCLVAVVVIIAISPLLAATLPIIYSIMKQWIGYLLIIVLGVLVVLSRKIIPAIIIILLASLLGIVSMQIPLQATDLALFPLLTGLFAFPMLLIQLRQKTNIPKQIIETEQLLTKETFLSAAVGSFAGMFSGLLPGVGASQAAMLSGAGAGNKNPESFIVRLGAISMSNIILSFMSLWLITRARSGAAVAIQNLLASRIVFGVNEFIFIIPIILVTSIIGAIATLFLAKHAIKYLPRINYSKLSLCVFASLIVLIALLTGPVGLLLATLATIVGLINNRLHVLHSALMAALITPTALFYLGILSL